MKLVTDMRMHVKHIVVYRGHAAGAPRHRQRRCRQRGGRSGGHERALLHHRRHSTSCQIYTMSYAAVSVAPARGQACGWPTQAAAARRAPAAPLIRECESKPSGEAACGRHRLPPPVQRRQHWRRRRSGAASLGRHASPWAPQAAATGAAGVTDDLVTFEEVQQIARLR